jgi:hypothetical protein
VYGAGILPILPSGQLSPDRKYFWNGTAWQSSLSSDGNWHWDGAEWQAADNASLPAPESISTSGAAAAAMPSPAAPKKKRRKNAGLRFFLVAFIFAILAGSLFYLGGYEIAGLVTMFAGGSGLAALAALGISGYRVARGRGRKWSVVLLAGVVALEAGMVIGLNTSADAKTAAGIALLQDYSAELGAASLLGDSVAAGNAPTGVTYATVGKDARSVFEHYYNLRLPTELMDYAAAVTDWASEVERAASTAEGGKPWVAPGPPAFHLALTSDQAVQAFATSQREIGTLVEFGNRALKDKNPAGIRYVGARLFAHYYWLFGVATSLDNTAVTARLHFIDGFSVSHRILGKSDPWTSGTRAFCHGGLCLGQILSQLGGMAHAVDKVTRSCSNATNTFNTNPACSASQDNIGLVPNWAASVTGLSAPSGLVPTNALHVAPLRFELAKGDVVSLIPPSGTQARVENLTVDPGEAEGATTLRVKTFKPRENWPICTPVIFNYVTFLNQRTPGGLEELIGSCGSGQTVPVPSRLQSFAADCRASGGSAGTTSETPPLMDRVPTTEGGWTCKQPATTCVSLLTYSGSEYQGGASGCTQKGLGPEAVASPTPNDSPAPPETPPAAPTPQCSAGYTYNPATGLCHGQAPPAAHCPPGYPYFHQSDQQCHSQPEAAPVTSYWLHYSCPPAQPDHPGFPGSGDQCAQVMGYHYGIQPNNALTLEQCTKYRDSNAIGMQPWSDATQSGTWCAPNPNPSTHP